ncbi:hypothetical protein A1D31_37595 [Bradyrhizobium liaoningense]|nr:hypothetical protein A1D31_37595 [Bradyrhizobium liaoningense]
MQVQHASSEDREAGEASQQAFEQQLANAREPHVEDEPVSQPPPARPTSNIRSIIERAVEAEKTRRNLSQSTVQKYAEALFKLERDLRSRGETIAALDHNCLLVRAEKFLSRDMAMAPALTALHRYRNPNAPDGPRRRYVVPAERVNGSIKGAAPLADNYPDLSETDRALVEDVVRNAVARGLKKSTVYGYGRALRSLGNELGSQGKAVSGLDHDALVLHARTAFPQDCNLLSALTALQAYREADALPDHGRNDLPSEEDASLIDGAVKAAAARRAWLPNTIEKYYRAFHNLTKSLQSRGQTIAALDHSSLLAHARASHEGDKNISAALEVLLEYRDPAILATRTRGNHPPSAKDKSLIEAAAAASERPRKAVDAYVKNLLRFAGALGARGQEIDQLEHIELLELAIRLFPSNKSLISGLGMIRDYRKAGRAPAAKGPPQEDDGQGFSPMLSVDPEELRRLLDNEPMTYRPTDNPTRFHHGMDHGDQLSTQSLGTAELLEMLASPGHSPEGTVNRPGAVVPPLVQAVDRERIWLETEHAGPLPAQSPDTAEVLEMFASAANSPADSINQARPTPLEDLENSTAGATIHAEASQAVMPALELYLPLGWQHGEQWATEDFKEGMRLHGVLPNRSHPEKRLTIQGVYYIASIGPPGLEHEIFLRRDR